MNCGCPPRLLCKCFSVVVAAHNKIPRLPFIDTENGAAAHGTWWWWWAEAPLTEQKLLTAHHPFRHPPASISRIHTQSKIHKHKYGRLRWKARFEATTISTSAYAPACNFSRFSTTAQTLGRSGHHRAHTYLYLHRRRRRRSHDKILAAHHFFSVAINSVILIFFFVQSRINCEKNHHRQQRAHTTLW